MNGWIAIIVILVIEALFCPIAQIIREIRRKG